MPLQDFKNVTLVDGSAGAPDGPAFKAFALFSTDLDQVVVLGAPLP